METRLVDAYLIEPEWNCLPLKEALYAPNSQHQAGRVKVQLNSKRRDQDDGQKRNASYDEERECFAPEHELLHYAVDAFGCFLS